MLAQKLTGLRIQQADEEVVPLHVDPTPNPARRRAVVRGLDFHAAIEMHRADTEAVIAKRFERERAERGLLLSEHRGDLAFRGAVDPRVGPVHFPAIEVRLRLLERLERLLIAASAYSEAPFLPLRKGASVGTSSPRRREQLLALRPDLEAIEIRGNVDTRVGKVESREYDAAVLAAAGVRRLGLEGVVTEWLSEDTLLPAPGQGALAIQCRADDEALLALLGGIDDAQARAETTAERAFLRALGGGCAAPVAALAVTTTTPQVRLQGLVASVDGREVVRVAGEGDPTEVGERLAEEALSRGADRILAGVR